MTVILCSEPDEDSDRRGRLTNDNGRSLAHLVRHRQLCGMEEGKSGGKRYSARIMMYAGPTAYIWASCMTSMRSLVCLLWAAACC